MKFVVKKSDLSASLSKASSVTENKATMPILSAVLVDARDGRVFISAYDLEVAYQASMEADVSKPGKVAVSAKTLGDVVKGLPAETVSLSVEKNRLVVTSGAAEFRLALLPVEEFPALPETTTGIDFTLTGSSLGKLLGRVGYCQSSDETRYTLNGTLLEGLNGLLCATATDGHRLAHAAIDVKAPDFKGVILSRKTTKLLKSMLGTSESAWRVIVSENAIIVEIAGELVMARLIDGQFPDYAGIYPKTEGKASVDVRELSSALGRLKLVSEATVWKVGGGVVKFRASDVDLGDVEDWLAHGGDAPDTTFGVNGGYVREALSVVGSDKVDFFFPPDGTTPLVLRYPSVTEGLEDYAIVMPMRV